MDRPAGRPAAGRRVRLASANVTPMHPVDVLLILTDAEHVLLALREGTGYAAIWIECAEV